VIAFINSRLQMLWLAGLLALPATVGSSVASTLPWIVRNWQSDEGLPDNTVVGIEQTPDGYLWVATKTGLVRFDGVRYQPFSVTVPGAPPGGVKGLLADRLGRLWIAKDKGVVLCVDQGVTTMVVGPDIARTQDEGERFMVTDIEDAVWVSYSGGTVLRIHNGQVRTFTAADGLPGGSDCKLARDGRGQLWFTQGGWVGVFREGKFVSLAQQSFHRIIGARGGGIWGYRDQQVWKFTEGGSAVKLGALPHEVFDETSTAMREDQSGCLWLGTLKAGLFRFDQDGGLTLPLPQQTILGLHEDREGNLWVGTRGGGLNRLKQKIIELLTTGSATSFEPVQSLCQDTEGRMWAIVWPYSRLMHSAGPGQKWSVLSPKDGWPASRSECVAADPQGGVWIGTSDSGIKHWQSGAVKETLNQSNGLATNNIGCLMATASGELWIGPRGAEVLQCRKDGQLRTFPLPSGSGAVVAFAEDAAGDCWVATYGRRLLQVHGEILTDKTTSTLQDLCEIRGLVGTPDGSLWIGYAGQGLGRLKAGRFSQWRNGEGLHDDYISNILPDGRGRLWFAGNRGIFSVREKDLDDCAAGRATRVHSETYGRNDGLLRLQANFNFWPGAQRGTDGRLLFAMQSGIAAVAADNLQKNPYSPTVVIEQVTANGQTVAAYQAGGLPKVHHSAAPLELGKASPHLHLAPDQRRLEFTFTALSLTKPETICFRYRLRPLDKDWIDAGTLRTATYAQIMPGRYQFEVSACNAEGAWSNTAVMMDLTVEPYWWETSWFRVFGPLAAAGLLGWGVFSGVQRHHRHQIERLEMLRATERERARIARDLHDEIGGSLTKIGKLAVGLPDPAIAETTREVVLAMDQVVWTVNPRNDSLDSLATYLVHYTEEFLRAAGIVCELDIPLILPDVILASDMRHNLFLTVKEALNNAVKHGAPQRVRLGLTVDRGLLTLTVQDYGCGFCPATATVGADGLGNMRDRLAAIGGELQILSTPSQGTTITMQVSLNSHNPS